MDVSEIVRIIAQMTGMNKREREQLEEIIEQFEDIDEIESFSDLEELDFENIDFEEFNFDEFGFDIDGGLGPRPGDRSVDDFRKDTSNDDDVDVEVPNDNSSGEPYHGQTWMEVEGKYETFVEIPEDASDLQITLEDHGVEVSEPVDETLETTQLPTNVTEIEVEKRGRRVLIKVY